MSHPVDPVCGRELTEPVQPFQLISGDESYFFCSQACLQKFQADVEAVSSDARPLRRPYADAE